MSDESYRARQVEMFWHMPPGASDSLTNILYLDAEEAMEIQREVDALQALAVKDSPSGHNR